MIGEVGAPVLAKRIIPCLDVDCGRVVKGTRFLNLKDAGDPDFVRLAADRFGSQCIVVVLTRAKADAALAASIFHWRKFTVAETKAAMQKAGVPVRMPIGPTV